MIADLLNTEITDVDTIESFPVGTILLEHRADGTAMAWRKEYDGWWYPSALAGVRLRGALAMAGVRPMLIWAPTGAVGYETDAIPQPRDGEHGTCAECGAAIEYFDCPDAPYWRHATHPTYCHDAELGGPA